MTGFAILLGPITTTWRTVGYCHRQSHRQSHHHGHGHGNVDAIGDDDAGAEVKLAGDGKEVHSGPTSLEEVDLFGKCEEDRNIEEEEKEIYSV